MNLIKATIAIAAMTVCCLGNDMPALANNDLALQKESNRMLKQALNQVNAGQWKAACATYKANVAYRQRHNLFAYTAVTGTGRLRELQLKQNKVLKEANDHVHEYWS